MGDERRVIIIGLDGVPFDLLKDLSETGVMPNTGKMISRGIFKKMKSSIPEISSVAWSSIITGANPAEHGIFGFMDLVPGTYNLYFPNFNNLRVRPFWNNIEGKSVIINVPSTYPVHSMNGVHISGFVSIDFEKSVYPSSLIPTLRGLDYCLDVDSEKAHESLALFLVDLDKTLTARIQAHRYLWDFFDWQIFMIVFTGTDRLMHFLWDAYEDENHKHHQDFLDHFRRIDEVIGEVEEKSREDDLLIIISDHGFEGIDKEVYLNYLLRKEGFLKFMDNREPNLADIDSSSVAFALDPSRVYLNLNDKYPRGEVPERNREKLLRELMDLFSSFQVDNRKVIKNIYRKEEIYRGPFLGDAPDLILVGHQGFNLRANIKAGKLADKTIFTGKHTQEDAFLLVKGAVDKTIISAYPGVSDVEKIIISSMREI